MVPPKITLYVDLVSPFAYISYHVLRNDPVFKDCEITYLPILLGGIMKMCGNQPPIAIKNKDAWTNKERDRWANLFGVPMQKTVPRGFPPRTLPVMRCLAALDHLDGTDQTRLTAALGALWDEFFVKHTPIQEPDQMRRILSSVLGSDAEADRIIKAAASDAEDGGKQILSRNTNTAFENGAFGLPWFVCTNTAGATESFWGVDHLGLVASFLGLEKPGTAVWKALL